MRAETPARDLGFPRPLSDRERAVLNFLLGVDDSRLDPLRGQAKVAIASGRCSCGCATIDLAVDHALARSAELCSPVLEARVPSPIAGDPDGFYEVVLFLDPAGWLESLEIVFYVGDPPLEFPPPDGYEAPWLRC
jgi:hypothetical protein